MLTVSQEGHRHATKVAKLQVGCRKKRSVVDENLMLFSIFSTFSLLSLIAELIVESEICA
jgi:hypothetical protein